MLIDHSHERLIALRLTGMAKAFDDQPRQPNADAFSAATATPSRRPERRMPTSR
jgi:hypothetical protein